MSDQETVVLAIDGGGTKTNAVCAALDGTILGEGESGPTNLTTTTAGAASFNLREAVRQSLEHVGKDVQIPIMVMGLAGMDSIAEHDHASTCFQQVLDYFGIKKLDLVNDVIIALENGTDAQDAIVLISGTGSNCFGRNAQGKKANAGGMDFLLTDEGSGYAIGRRVLRDSVRAFDGRGPHTVLEELVCQKFDITSVAGLKDVVYNPLLTKIEIADLAPLCFEALKEGDEVASKIIQDTVLELDLLAKSVIHQLEFEHMPFSAVFSGSIVMQQSIRIPLVAGLQKDAPLIQPIFPETPPVYGALKMALKLV